MSVEMVAPPSWTIRCDGMDGRLGCGRSLFTQSPNKTAATAYAVSRWGWKATKGRLLCPNHQA